MDESIDPGLIEKVERKKKERQEEFIKLGEKYSLNARARFIVGISLRELRLKIRSRELSAREVLEAFCAKALEVNEKFNCVTEFIPQALEWASALDAIPRDNELGPLHGLPVAIKDDHDIQQMDTSLGFSKNLYKPVKECAVLVKILLKLGAVPFLKTNVPQSLFSNGSDNPIFGTTLNSLNANLTPGGSSSGSACLVAAGGAVFATGSDLGGSLRTPSHFHGICSLRPTGNRLSDKGVMQCLPELHILPGVPGIIAPNAETLSFVWKAITENSIQNQFDPMAIPIPWNDLLFSSNEKLRIGYFTSLPFFPSFEDTQRTVLAAKEAFISKGYKVVEFEMPDDFHCLKIICDLLMADQGKYLKKMFKGEPVSYCVAELVESIRKSDFQEADKDVEKKRCTKMVDQSNLNRRESIFFGDWGASIRTAGDLWGIINEKRRITQDILDRMKKTGVDLLLSPAFPFPAVKLDRDSGGLPGFVYTAIWSFVNFPAGVVRFGTETGTNIECYNDENDSILKSAKEALMESADMPINVQIISTPYKEELVLRAMVELENMWIKPK